MTNDKILMELIVAIGYALDSANNSRTNQDRKECRELSEKILHDVLDFLKSRNPEKTKLNLDSSRSETDKTK